MGIVDGLLDPDRTVRRLNLDGPSDSTFGSTEIFGDEVCSLVTDTALYRETAFTVFMPSSNPMISRLRAYLDCKDTMDKSDLLDDLAIECPWAYARRHISVSFVNMKIFSYFKNFYSYF